MSEKEIILRGAITDDGELMIYGLRDLENFSKKEKRPGGSDILLRITILPKKGKQKMIGYIKGKIYPEFVRAFRSSGLRLTKEQAESKIKNFTTVCRGRELEDLEFHELMNMIDELKEIAAEHFNFYIDDAVVV